MNTPFPEARRMYGYPTLALLVGLLFGTRLTAVELADFNTDLFSGAGNCAMCHDSGTIGRGMGRGRGAPVLTSDWAATMMANSFKDPLWRAVMEYEVGIHSALKPWIEDKCQTCHAPLARTQARFDGTNQLAFAVAADSPLAGEGVGCTLCHQIQNTGLGTPASFTGHYAIGTNRTIFGPYDKVFAMPMIRHVDYTPIHGAHVQDSGFCAPCHTLFTPILNKAGEVSGEFPEQVPFLEWRHSTLAEEGIHCQDCHMPRLDTPVKISRMPPWLPERSPFWKHQFVGGNAFMLELLAANDELQPNAEPNQLLLMADEALEQLQRAARLQLDSTRDADTVRLRVKVQNLTGHKFPTGHPFRRAWLHVSVLDRKGKTIFESGAWDKSGALMSSTSGYSPHYDVITRCDQVQVYQSVMAEPDGNPTWSLLRAAKYLKDNRIPPRGFTSESAPAEVAIWGEARLDANFNPAANGSDEVTYHMNLPKGSGPLRATVQLLYQSVPPESIRHLLNSNKPAATQFQQLYQRQNAAPKEVDRVELEF